MAESGRCPHAPDVAAFVQAELPPPRQQEFALHLQGCAACARDVAATRALLDGLGTLPGDVWELRRRRTSPWAPLAAAAALLAAVTGALAFLLAEDAPPAPSSDAPIADAVDPMRLLVAALGPDGTWTEVARTSPARRTSLHALALLALARGDVPPEALGAAADWLLLQQDDSGVVGAGSSDGSTDQALAAVALAEVARLAGSTELAAAARSAAAAFVAQAATQRMTPAQRAWAGQALAAAASLDVPGVEAARRRLDLDRDTGPDPESPARGTPGDSVGELHAAATAVLASTGR